jgi:3-isopropylmalate/(R)-2-methylmalate dehydratase small subunit
MDPITHITGTAAPLRRSDVDTDQIIPAEWLKRVERTGFGEGLFGAWRKDKSFVLNDPAYKEAVVLVAGPNFGTGSSREHAVWALTDFGFKAVVSPRFGDIFRNNATKAGLVPVQVDEAVAEQLMAAVERDPAIEVTVDIVERTLRVRALGIEVPFPLDDFTRYRLVEGLDDIGLTLRNEESITTYESRRPAWAPTTSTTSA